MIRVLFKIRNLKILIEPNMEKVSVFLFADSRIFQDPYSRSFESITPDFRFLKQIKVFNSIVSKEGLSDKANVGQ